MPAISPRDAAVARVTSGTCHIGYGDKFDEAKLKALPPGSFYTEPPSRNHFAETGDEPVVVQITGFGPSSTEYVDATQDPRKSQPIAGATPHRMRKRTIPPAPAAAAAS